MHTWRTCLINETNSSSLSHNENSQLTTESSTGKKILAVLKFDVTSVKSPLIIIITKITAAWGISARNRSARATLSDNCEAFEN